SRLLRPLKAALLPLRGVVEARLRTAALDAAAKQRPAQVPPGLALVVDRLPSRVLVAMAAHLDAPETQDMAVELLRAAYRRSKSVGLTPYINILAKHGRREELGRLIDEILARKMDQKVRLLGRAVRAQEALGEKAEEVAVARHEVHQYLVKTLERSKSRK